MKVTKTVNDFGNINISFNHIPTFDGYNVKFISNTAQVYGDKWITHIDLKYMQFGGLEWNILDNPAGVRTTYKKTDSVITIAEAIHNRHKIFSEKIQKYLAEHDNKTAETTNRNIAIEQLDNDKKLLYRGKDGKFHQLK